MVPSPAIKPTRQYTVPRAVYPTRAVFISHRRGLLRCFLRLRHHLIELWFVHVEPSGFLAKQRSSTIFPPIRCSWIIRSAFSAVTS